MSYTSGLPIRVYDPVRDKQAVETLILDATKAYGAFKSEGLAAAVDTPGVYGYVMTYGQAIVGVILFTVQPSTDPKRFSRVFIHVKAVYENWRKRGVGIDLEQAVRGAYPNYRLDVVPIKPVAGQPDIRKHWKNRGYATDSGSGKDYGKMTKKP